MTNISLPDLVAERIKSSELGQIIKEEDIYDIAKLAMEKAFFEKREVKEGYNTKTLPPLVVEMAQTAFKEAIEQAMVPVTAAIIASDEFRDALASAIQTSLPNVMTNYGYGAVMTAMQQTHSVNMNNLKTSIENNIAFCPIEMPVESAIK